jgi:hypothetical protein
MRIGDFKNPKYEFEDGTIVHLRTIRTGILVAYNATYKQQNPPPVPPTYIMQNGEEAAADFDPAYQHLLTEWTERMNYQFILFLIDKGVIDEAPVTFESFGLALTPKQEWILSYLDETTLADFQNAVMGLSMPTEQGIADAEKN